MKTELIVGDHQTKIQLSERILTMLEEAGAEAARLIVAGDMAHHEAPLASLECVEVALVDDETSSRVHAQFMGIEGETDVITFEHGEIVIGVEVARRQAVEYGEPEQRELLRYLVHGLLHLAGHEDEKDEDRKVMEEAQERLVGELWKTIEP
ncbi:rRNA maturation RNase YbeY [Haloferula chungangensis]|uniref:Endoribonuclease YbeY n=1 Tax=Haloferula chungangensis TaxID=1048331 RepID=A0ABW2L4D2_9BACT